MASNFKLHEYLVFQFFIISSMSCRELSEIYGRYDIDNNKEWRIMALLFENNRMFMSEIAAESFIDSVNLTRAVENLFQKKLCERYYDTQDRRRVEVEISEKGKEVMDLLMTKLDEFNEKLKNILGDSLSSELQKKYPEIIAAFSKDEPQKRI